jgi:tRNA pseudouridine55 synthase
MGRSRRRSNRASGPNAVVILDKPEGMTSHTAVTRVKSLSGAYKAGHTGTLDPFATGVLPVCLNQATKASRFLLENDKVYEATMLLGVETDTWDLTGEVVATGSTEHVTPLRVAEVREHLVGAVEQKTPAFSAVKVNGTPLYRLARQGKKPEVPPRRVEIKELEIVDIQLPRVAFRVRCSSGTYVRSLVWEWGQRLGCGAHVTALRRLRCGPFGLDRASTLKQVEQACRSGRPDTVFMDVNKALDHLPAIRVHEDMARKIRNGWLPDPAHLDGAERMRLQHAVPFRVIAEQEDLVALMAPVCNRQTRCIERFRFLRVFVPEESLEGGKT